MTNLVIAGATGAIGSALIDYWKDRADVRIWALCRSPKRLECEKREVVTIPWDAEDQAGLGVRLEEAWGRGFHLHGAIYCAGVLHGSTMWPEKRLEALDAENLSRAFMVNAGGFGLLIRHLLPWMRHGELTRIMAISAKVGSIADNHMGGWYAYRSSKAALNMLVRTLSIELARRLSEATCVAVHPGTTLSPLSEPFQDSLAKLPVRGAEDTGHALGQLWESLTQDQNGQFLNWDGSSLPW